MNRTAIPASVSADGATPTDAVRKVARGGALNLVGSVIYGIANFAFVIVITRMLGASRAGTLIVAIAVFTVARGISVLGANTGLVRMVRATPEESPFGAAPGGDTTVDLSSSPGA